MYFVGITAKSKMSDSEEDGVGISPFEEQPQKAAKRKRDKDSTSNVANAKKRRKSRKPKDVEDDALDANLGINHAIARMDSRLMADHVAQRTRRFQTELSTLEMEDSHIPGKCGESYFQKAEAYLEMQRRLL